MAQYDQQLVLWIPSDSSQVCLSHDPEPYCIKHSHLYHVSPLLVPYICTSLPSPVIEVSPLVACALPDTCLLVLTPCGPVYFPLPVSTLVKPSLFIKHLPSDHDR